MELEMQNNPKQQKQPDNAAERGPEKDRPTDGDIANGEQPVRPPNDPEPQESWGDKQSRHARENEKALGEGKPEPWPHD